MATTVLLKRGTVLSHDNARHVTALQDTDILVEGDLIKEIAKDIKAPPNAEIVDCTGKIISPGFVNTHQHLWQTQLKGRHAEHTLIDYMCNGNMASYCYAPDDVFWGQLSGCLESLNAGTTTVLDHNHASYTPEHATRALSASAASGIRTIFAYMTHFMRLQEWNKSSIEMQQELLPEWPFQQLESWCSKPPIASGRVQLGFAFDFFFLGAEAVTSIYNRMRSLTSIKLITSHVGKNATMGTSSVVDLLKSINQLHGPQLFSHANNLSPAEYSALASAGIPISTTPFTEYQMGMSNAVAFNRSINYPHTSLGVDCHSANTSSMPAQARTALLIARGIHAHSVYEHQNGAEPRTLLGSAEHAFNLITIQGARALGMDHQIGSIAPGKKADLVVFDATSPNMLGAEENDAAVVAVVMHSDVADVEGVMVDGIWRKKRGKLCEVRGRMDLFDEGKEKERVWEWRDVVREVKKSGEAVRERWEGVDPEKARQLLMQAWQVDESKLV